MRHGELSAVPCVPTDSGAKLQLWKNLGQGEMKEVSLALAFVEFDPMRGFIIYYPHSYNAGHFVCNGSVPGHVYNDSSMAMVLAYLTSVDIVPKVKFEKGINFDPVPNGSFTLNCTVTVEAVAIFNMSWDYPNKSSSRMEVKTHVRLNKALDPERFMLFVVTSQLTVRDVKRSDEGWYTCSCRDYDGKAYNHSVFVYV
ncbi:hypothetical protein V5799_011646 [Amblyomma americanum]|uniref:Ig-like domain-containing protein n=1 Tax=Amblyomma americanum TaxID=6943 RepID=A0AAQ4EGN6_AMBAM